MDVTQTNFGFDTAVPPEPWSAPSTPLKEEWAPGKIEHSVPLITTPGFPPPNSQEYVLVPAPRESDKWFVWAAEHERRVRYELGIYNEEELAAALGVTADTLGQWRAKNTGPEHVKLGKAVFYRRDDVAKWIKWIAP